MAQGVISRTVDDRKCGFIKADDGSGDVFFHFSACEPRIAPASGLRVSFEMATAADGRVRARDVRQVRG
jgi:cold shock CspA family protein